jgi:hypothetical protein
VEHCDVVLKIFVHPLDIDRYCTTKSDISACRPNQRERTVEHWTNIFIRMCGQLSGKVKLVFNPEANPSFLHTEVLLSPYPDQEGHRLKRHKILSFIYPIYNHNWRSISTIYE